jgi:hypothetical protein
MSKPPSQYAPNDAALEHSKAKTLEQSISRLQADHAERSAEQRARHAEDARIQDRVRDLMFGHLRSKEVELKQLAEDRRRLIEGRPPKLVRRLSMEGLAPRTFGKVPSEDMAPRTFGKVPPYDFTWTSGSGQGGESATTEGNIELNAQAFGEKSVGGGIGFWFPAAAGGARRFSTTCRFSFEWSDSAMLHVADNQGRVWLSVWGMSENGWVGTSGDQFPSWLDHVGWYEEHQNSGGGETSQELFFNAQPNGLYACWVNASIRCYADNGVAGFGLSTARLHIALAAVYVE